MEELRFIKLVLVCFSILPFYGMAQTDTTPIRQSFNFLKAALIEENGKEAVKYIDDSTLTYYSQLYQQAKTLDSLQVENLSVLNKAHVFALRVKAQTQPLPSANGKPFFVYAVDNGLVDKVGPPISGTELGSIIIDKSGAKGQLMLNNTKLPYFVNFRYEKNEWKVDITSLFSITTQLLHQLAVNSNMTDTDFILETSQAASDAKVRSSIWKPLQHQ
jgi:hypothetical protein